VFFGRLIPGARSLISVPAGAARMPVAQFLLYTTAGSVVWNTALVMAGRALGSQYELVAEYSDYLNYAVIAVLVALLAWLVVRRVRRNRASSGTAA
jgi:membrane protein DedA with SNARE-associated domain